MFLKKSMPTNYKEAINLSFEEVAELSQGRLKQRSDKLYYCMINGEEVTTPVIRAKHNVTAKTANNRLKMYALTGDRRHIDSGSLSAAKKALMLRINGETTETLKAMREHELFVQITKEDVIEIVGDRVKALDVYKQLDSGLLSFAEFKQRQAQGVYDV